MRLLITGSPGVGKTTIARELGKKLKSTKVLNEMQFALQKRVGRWDVEENEFVIPLRKIERALNKELKKKNLIVEGHTLCETKLAVDFVVLIRVDPEILEARLEEAGYKAEKIQDNVFCEGIDYCKKHVERKYAKKKIIEVYSKKTIKETTMLIINELKKRGHK